MHTKRNEVRLDAHSKTEAQIYIKEDLDRNLSDDREKVLPVVEIIVV